MSRSKITPVGRASFPHLDKPNMFDKYALAILLPKDGKDVPEFVAWLKEAVDAEAKAQAGEKGYVAAMRYFVAFKDGDDPDSFKTYREEYAGCWVLNLGRASKFGKPTCVNRNKQPIDPSEIYAGCDVIAYIDVFGYTFKHKKSVSIGFQHVMKVADNEPFSGGGVDVESAFDDIDLPEEEAPTAPDNPFGASAESGSSDEVPNSSKPQPNVNSNPFGGM